MSYLDEVVRTVHQSSLLHYKNKRVLVHGRGGSTLGQGALAPPPQIHLLPPDSKAS